MFYIIGFIIGGLLLFIVGKIEYKFPFVNLIVAFIFGLVGFFAFLMYKIGHSSLFLVVILFLAAINSLWDYFRIKNRIKRIKINLLNKLNKKDIINSNDIVELIQIGEVSSRELVTVIKNLMKKGEIPYIHDIDKYYNLTK